MRYRKKPETIVPTTFVTLCSCELPFFSWSSSARIPKFSSTAITKTTVECPSEKKKPTLKGLWPSVISLRVVLSIAEMWSASKACRIPRVRARMPVPNPKISVLDIR